MRSNTRAKRAAVVAGVAAVSLAAATAPAGAAVGGANPSNFTNNPNLRTVTLTDNGTAVVALYTFDKPLQAAPGGPVPGNFTLGSYAANNRETANAASLVSGKPNTVEAVFDDPGNPVDIGEITNGSVLAGTVASQAVISKFNLADSVAATSSIKDESGTRGHTAAPDLVGVKVDDSNINGNRLLFTFDQKVTAFAAGANFSLVTNTGTIVPGDQVTKTNDYTVGVRFPNTVSVLDAKRAFISPGAATGANGLVAPQAAQALPGTNGTTARPDLLSAQSSTSGGTLAVTYVYDETLTGATVPGNFQVFTAARSTPATATSASINADGKSVTAIFGGIPDPSQYNEHLVYAGSLGGAVTGTGGASYNDGAAVGGNAGANASGYTTAPEALKTTFDANSGIVGVTFDNRLAANAILPPGIFGVTEARIHLIGADGILVPGPNPTALNDGGATSPAQTTVNFKFQPDQVKAASAIQLDGVGGGLANAVLGANYLKDGAAAANIQQILSPTATAASIAPVGTPKSAFRFAKPKTVAVIPAKVQAALKPTKSKARAKANAKVLAKFYAGKKGYRVSVKKAATK